MTGVELRRQIAEVFERGGCVVIVNHDEYSEEGESASSWSQLANALTMKREEWDRDTR